ncbi:MAG: hypothetical protein Q9218_005160 [Villophora microphyllina]
MPTLRRVTREHPTLPAFVALLRQQQEIQQPAPTRLTRASADEVTAMVMDLENLRKENIEPTSEGSVYLIHMEGTSFYKIGMSLDPQIRLRTLQTGNPYTLTIRRTQVVGDMRSAESDLHRQFGAQRVLNTSAMEWFDLGRDTSAVEAAFDEYRTT